MEAGTIARSLSPHEAAAAGAMPRTGVMKWLLTTDHKLIGVMYVWLSFFFFAVAGIFALIMRTQLSAPGLHVVRPEIYNQIMSLHGTFMVFFFTIPVMAVASFPRLFQFVAALSRLLAVVAVMPLRIA